MSRIRRVKPGQFAALRAPALLTVAAVNKLVFALACLWSGLCAFARAETVDSALAQRVEALARQASAQAAPGLRVEVKVGQLDPRLKLAPCAQVQPYLPSGTRLWGAARIGLRCVDGATRWNVFLPVTVSVYGPALVTATALVAGSTLSAQDLKTAEVDLAARPGAVLTQAQAQADPLVGRTLARALPAGEPLRAADLRARQWFAAGDTVRIVAAGRGWRIHGEGQALNPGVEGLPVRVRTESGRIVSGMAVAERQVEVAL
jgi:flagella basal body P-ring formation protein FlgA